MKNIRIVGLGVPETNFTKNHQNCHFDHNLVQTCPVTENKRVKVWFKYK